MMLANIESIMAGISIRMAEVSLGQTTEQKDKVIVRAVATAPDSSLSSIYSVTCPT